MAAAGAGCSHLLRHDAPAAGRFATYDMVGTYLSVRLLSSTAPTSVLPPIDRGDVPSPLGVLDAVWWREVCDIDASALRADLAAVAASRADLVEMYPAIWADDGYCDVDEWGRWVRPSVARPERYWDTPTPGLAHLVVRVLPLREVMRLSLLCMAWRQALH